MCIGSEAGCIWCTKICYAQYTFNAFIRRLRGKLACKNCTDSTVLLSDIVCNKILCIYWNISYSRSGSQLLAYSNNNNNNKLTDVGFRAHIEIASRSVAYRSVSYRGVSLRMTLQRRRSNGRLSTCLDIGPMSRICSGLIPKSNQLFLSVIHPQLSELSY